jgi:hypothetical protein
MTAEHAHGIDAGGGVVCAHFCAACKTDAVQRMEDAATRQTATTRATAADAVLAEARRLCCGENPAAHHAATDKHSELMPFAGRLAGAVRGR